MTTDIVGLYVDDAGSFEELYRAEYPGLVAVASALTGDFRTGEDLVQDTMVKAYLRWSWLRNFGRPGAWCHRVLTNACHDWRRKVRIEARFRQRTQIRDLVDEPSLEAVEFWAAVRKLPQRPRLVITLFYAADKTTAEVASILRVPDGTVRSDLSRARIALAKELGMLP